MIVSASKGCVIPTMSNSSSSPPKPTTIITLPKELLAEIFAQLDPIDAAEAGISHSNLYEAYKLVYAAPATQAVFNNGTDSMTSSPTSPSPGPTTITSLPKELLAKIIDHLEPFDATMAGISHPKLYEGYKLVYKTPVSLYEFKMVKESCSDCYFKWHWETECLYQTLERWMYPKVFCLFVPGGPKFTRRARADDLRIEFFDTP